MRQKYISKSTLEERIEALERAVEIDSTFEEAYAAIAEVYINYLYWGYDEYSHVVGLAEKNNANSEGIYGLMAGLTPL